MQPLSGPDPGDPGYGNLLVSRLPLAGVVHPRRARVAAAPVSDHRALVELDIAAT